MSLSGLSLTNQRIFFSKLQLQQYASLIDGDSEPAMQAQYESVVFHLNFAYQAFLSELIETDNRGLVLAEAQSASVLVGDCETGSVSPELKELALLEGTGESESVSWLAGLQAAYKQLGAAGGYVGSSGAVQHSEISVTMLSENDDKLSELRFWHQSLASTVQRLRTMSQEW